MTAYAWPAVLKPQDFRYFLENVDQSGGVAMGGNESFVVSPGPRWRAKGRFPVRTREQVLALNELEALLDGRANDILLPGYDGQRLSWPEQTFSGDPTGVILTPKVARELEGTAGLGGTAYAGLEIPAAAEIVATVNTNAALRATTLLINKTQGGALIAGQHFGLGQRFHRIRSIELVFGPVTTVTIRPPLRAAATSGTAVLFTRPVSLMKLADPSQLHKALELLRFGDFDFDFVESF